MGKCKIKTIWKKKKKGDYKDILKVKSKIPKVQITPTTIWYDMIDHGSYGVPETERTKFVNAIGFDENGESTFLSKLKNYTFREKSDDSEPTVCEQKVYII